MTKHDTSSFYNFEEDNEPIYDLEERTYLLWERLGHPTSSIPGLALVVSADAPASAIGCNKNIFATVSAAIAALPDVINYPVLIEICNFGTLGDLKLDNIKFGPRGSIEIINRNFGKQEPRSKSLFIPLNQGVFSTSAPYTNEHYLSEVSAIGGYGQSVGAKNQIITASSLILGSLVLTGDGDVRMANNGNTVMSIPSHYGIVKSTLTLNQLDVWYDADPYESVSLTAYEYNPAAYEGVDTYDTSTYNEITGGDYISYLNSLGYVDVVGYVSFNKFNKVVVNNCNGPIYLRNLFVDGSGFYGTTQYGFEVRNSNGVFIEDCISVRNRKAGFYFQNSKVNTSRGMVACRNYDFDTAGNRLTGPWSQKKYGMYSNASSMLSEGNGAGILAENSEIFVSSTSAHYVAAVASDPVFSSLTVLTPIQHLDYLYLFSKNDIGIKLVNSKLHGGYSDEPTYTVPSFMNINLVFEGNTEYGLKATNSEIDWDGTLVAFDNLRGIILDNSNMKYEKMLSWLNQREGLKASNSKLVYNKNLQPKNLTPVYQTYTFSGNAQHIVLDNSVMDSLLGSSVFNTQTTYNLQNSHGVQYKSFNVTSPDGVGLLPSISIRNNSYARLLHVLSERSATNMLSGRALKGAAIEVVDNSKLVLNGSERFATRIVGPNTYLTQRKKSGLYAGNRSTIEVAGPTVIAQYAIDALAEDGSRILFTPAKENDSRFDIQNFNLSNEANHTMVELHSTRACLVANRGSEIGMKDLGDFNVTWDRTVLGQGAIASGVDYDTTGESLYLSAGFIQFYPNPDGSDVYGPGVADVGFSNSTRVFTKGPYGNYYYLNEDVGTAGSEANLSSTTAGGVCVMAVNGSLVDVQNVNFPCGWWNPSSVIYDLSASNGLCDRLFIWEIKDNSHINASYCSVSSLFPADAGYFGPKGAWETSPGVYASNAPNSTPDTSSLSVLDYFGACSANPYGKTTQQNFGPFRLYFSVDPAVNCLATPGAYNDYGRMPQVYAQGYQASSNIGFQGNVSSMYPSLLKMSNGALTLSSFFYGSAIMNNPNSVRAILDESAGDTFANARHCTVGKSGLAKVAYIYLPYTDTKIGDSASNSAKNSGIGFRSVNTFDLEKDN